MSVDIKTDDVSIRCMGCSQMKTLEEAIRDSWKMCKHCNFAICSYCINYLGAEQKCLSYLCTQQARKLEITALPVEKILIFARENSYQDYRQGLLYKLFYHEQEQQQTAPFFVIKEKPEPVASDREIPTKIQEEVWKNFQLVVTKRRGGKFITWERVM